MFKTALLVAMFCLVPFGLKAQQEQRGVPGMALVQSMKPVACGEYRLIDKDLRELLSNFSGSLPALIAAE